MRALPVEVFRSNLGDCSNGGISSKYDEVLIPCETGFIEIDENDLPENFVNIVERHPYGNKTYFTAYPAKEAEGVGWMFGGTFIYSSDGRFPFDYPVPLHDRTETQEQYNMLSH